MVFVVSTADAICLERPRLLPSIPNAIQIPPTDISAGNHHLAVNWLRKCLAEHSLCNTNLASSTPRRLLEIGSAGDSAAIRLVEWKSSIEQYATLSYCWGQCENYKLTETTKDELTRGIRPDDLPSTIRDAIRVTQMLGLSYLWVDALCIFQDSPSDWEDQSYKMAGIYKGCTVMIAPTEAESCSAGFLSKRQPNQEIPSNWLLCAGEERAQGVASVFASVFVHLRSKARCGGTASYNASKFNGDILPNFTRAWCYQEHALAPRVLYVDRTEFSFSCRSGRVCECNGAANWTLGDFGTIHQAAKASILEMQFASHLNQVISKDVALKHWEYAAVQYCGRKLTFHRDQAWQKYFWYR